MANDALDGFVLRLLKDVWFVKGNEKQIVQDAGVRFRAGTVAGLLPSVSKLDSKRKPFDQRLILDDYIGGMQRYLVGEVVYSLLLTSGSMEVGLLNKIGSITQAEEKEFRAWSTADIVEVAFRRGLLKGRDVRGLVYRTVTKRNMFAHGAIAQEIVRRVLKESLDELLDLLGGYKSLIGPIITPMFGNLSHLEELADLKWYVGTRTYSEGRKLILEFLEEPNRRLIDFIRESKYSTVLAFPKLIQDSIELMKSVDVDYLRFAAQENLHHVHYILSQLYSPELFKP